jgi:probable rRNA maturation factor
VLTTLRSAGRALGIGPGDVVVRFIDGAEMRALNERWRGRRSVTDVLSFPSHSVDPLGRRHIGDIAICIEVARAQATKGRRALRREVSQLALHGLLHLLGYDHETDDGEMAALERKLRGTASAGRGATAR